MQVLSTYKYKIEMNSPSVYKKSIVKKSVGYNFTLNFNKVPLINIIWKIKIKVCVFINLLYYIIIYTRGILIRLYTCEEQMTFYH